MNILGIIPARVGSVGIPNKNLIGGPKCGGKPLIQWTLDAAQDSKLLTHWLVSTSDYDTWKDAGNRGGLACRRPTNLETHDSPTEDTIEHALDYTSRWTPPFEWDIIVLLQLTSPVRTGRQIDDAIEQLIREGADSLVSVVKRHTFLWDKEALPWYDIYQRPMRQNMDSWEENGSIYAFTMEHWNKRHNRLGGKISLYEMPENSRIQIDSPLDLLMVDAILTDLKEKALVH